MAIIVGLGKKGTGKSTLLRKLVWLCLKDPKRPPSESPPLFFFHDPHHSIAELPGIAKRWASVAACRDHITKRGALTPLSLFADQDVDAVCRLACEVRDVTVVLDEFDRATDGKKWLAPTAGRIVHEGRHSRVGLWGTFRRTANVPEDLLTQADWVFIFRHSAMGSYDIQGLERRIGPEYARAIESLEVGRFVAWRDA